MNNATPKTAFVSSSDYNYFPMLIEWVHSIRRFPQSAMFDICILNAGLKPEQVNILKSFGCIVKDAQWPCELPADKIKGKDYLKSCVCRPFIPEYFPEYDTYIWMDADTWLQKWDVIDVLMQGTQNDKIALMAQTDRGYHKQIRIKWFGRWPIKVSGFYMRNAVNAFGMTTAKKLFEYQVLQAGVFAINKKAPAWKLWQDLILKALLKGKTFTAEQLTLGILCHLEKYPHEILPAYMHWLCEYKPLWDEQKNMFVEPSLPHEEIGILHISGWDKMRLDRNVTTDFKTVNGGTITHTYRYPYFDGEKILDLQAAA